MIVGSPIKARSRADLLALAALACGGLILLALISRPYWYRVALGQTDFLSFYAGGRLAFTSRLYDPSQAMAIQLSAAHVTSPNTFFIRMPWFAAAMWPLARLPYVPAQLIWQALLFAGLIAFLALWPRPSLGIRVAVLCFSLPAMICILMGQDVPLLLACMASLALLKRGKPLIAGLVLSLTLAKFHLFLPLFPAVLFARRWKFATGFLSGTSILMAASFLVSGPNWPRQFLAAISDPTVTPAIGAAPSFYYLIHGTPAVRNLAMAALGIALMILYLPMARKNVEFLIAAAPAVILPLLPHAGAYDCLLLTPLALLALDLDSRDLESRPAKLAAALLLLPATYLIAWSLPSAAMLIPVLDVALLGLVAMPSLFVPAKTISRNPMTARN